jgi:hypothetical protein
MIDGCQSFGKPSTRTVCPNLDQFDELTKRMKIESANRAAAMLGVPGCSEVGPFPSHRESATLGITQDQRVDAGYRPGLQYRKALAATGMEGVRDLSPSRRVAGRGCS